MKKRAFVFSLTLLALCLTGTWVFAAEKPNILVVMGDDIGY